MSNKKEIIEEALTLLLKAVKSGHTNYRISEDTKITQPTIGNYVNGKTKPTYANAKILIDYFRDINVKPNLKELDNPIDTSTPIKTTNQGVPYYNVDFIGGFDLVENDQTATPDYYIDFQKYNSADCWCNVTGHSMEPSISNGDIIALKEIIDWRIFLPFGEIYAIVTSEHRTIKKVTGSLNPEKFLLIPLNPDIEFQRQEIPISIIMKVYKVLGCVKKF